MTSDDEKIARSIAYEAANVVADKTIKHIEQTTIVALGSAQKEIDALRREHELKIEALRNERELKLAAQAQERHAEIAAHAAQCPVKKQSDETKQAMDAMVNQASGGWRTIVTIAAFLSGVGALVITWIRNCN